MFPLTGTYKRAGRAKHSITYQFKRVTQYKFTQVDYPKCSYILDMCLKYVIKVTLAAK